MVQEAAKEHEHGDDATGGGAGAASRATTRGVEQRWLDAVARSAAADAGGRVELLGQYLWLLADAAVGLTRPLIRRSAYPDGSLQS